MQHGDIRVRHVALRLEATAFRLEAIATRVEAIAISNSIEYVLSRFKRCWDTMLRTGWEATQLRAKSHTR